MNTEEQQPVSTIDILHERIMQTTNGWWYWVGIKEQAQDLKVNRVESKDLKAEGQYDQRNG